MLTPAFPAARIAWMAQHALDPWLLIDLHVKLRICSSCSKHNASWESIDEEQCICSCSIWRNMSDFGEFASVHLGRNRLKSDCRPRVACGIVIRSYNG